MIYIFSSSIYVLCSFGHSDSSITLYWVWMQAGLDSIGAVELRNAVSSKFGIELPATVTYDHPSVDALARFIASKISPGQDLSSEPMVLGGSSFQSQAALQDILQQLVQVRHNPLRCVGFTSY